MDNIAGRKSSLSIVTNISVMILVLLWLIPSVGLLVSSFRDRVQISESAWWESMFPVFLPGQVRPEAEGVYQADGLYVLEGNVYGLAVRGQISQLPEGRTLGAFGATGREPTAFEIGQTALNFDYDVAGIHEDVIDDDEIWISREGGDATQLPTIDELRDHLQRDIANVVDDIREAATEVLIVEIDPDTGEESDPVPPEEAAGDVPDRLQASFIAAVTDPAATPTRVADALGDLWREEVEAVLADEGAISFAFVESLSVNADGDFVFQSVEEIDRAPSIYVSAETPPEFTTDNYQTVLTGQEADSRAEAYERGATFGDLLADDEGIFGNFVNTFTVTIPATIIPILIAAFAAYALAWMDFPGRGLLIAAVVGLLVVPLQLALVPLLRLHEQVGIGQSFVGIWLAHTGFGLPLAIYLLRNYMVGLPRDIIESAKVDGATDFQIFTRIILPLSFPALASFAIFQFLWTWNDLLVAKVFLPAGGDSRVMTVRIADDLLGSRGGDWGILAAAAFVSIAVPLLVFFTMQRYLVRGLLAGSVK